MVIGFWWIALLLMILVPALGLMLIVRGFRGRVDFSSPHCRRCEYDLRWIKPDEQKHCPECGSDLTAKRAVSFGRYGRNLPMLIMGTLLLLLPIGVIITGPILTARAVQAGPGGVATKTNQELIADLSTTASQPWTWRELYNRFVANELSDEEAAEAIDELVAYLQSQTGQPSPLTWSEDFVTAVMNAGVVTDDQRSELIRAFYDRDAPIHMRQRIRTGEAYRFRIDAGSAWHLPDMTIMTSLSDVEIDGAGTVAARNMSNRDEPISGSGGTGLHGVVTVDAEPGTHTLTFVIDIGVKHVGGAMRSPVQHRPGPVEDWPETLDRWTKTVTKEIEVLPADESPIELIRGDEDLAQSVRDALRVRELRVTEREARVEGQLMLTYGPPPVPVAFSVLVRYDDRETRMGTLGIVPGSGASISGNDFRQRLQSFPEHITEVDVVFQPEPALLEQHFSVEEVWGEDVIFENVPVVWPEGGGSE